MERSVAESAKDGSSKPEGRLRYKLAFAVICYWFVCLIINNIVATFFFGWNEYDVFSSGGGGLIYILSVFPAVTFFAQIFNYLTYHPSKKHPERDILKYEKITSILFFVMLSELIISAFIIGITYRPENPQLIPGFALIMSTPGMFF
ncbi:hypothetical protein [Mobiluncus porci]|uniref:Uncharacterized protein n=1 Tax=Mobiluncus porci TaxID=2652278 RepID=A0A7K0K1P8_9ACTO|nr:hypothetical protein [Mobiluncus porci]MST48980.1 hypothetical protein [Mobiluncus porci]